MEEETRRLRIGVSACLLGEEVRYNGGHKRDPFLTDVLGRYIEWVPVCPEVEIGLGTPRPAMRLVRIGEDTRMVTPETGADHTGAMRAWSERRVEELATERLAGYILKKDSPSCGMERVKLYPAEGGAPGKDARGLFAEALLRRHPDLPVEEEGRLHDPLLRENFVTRIFVRDRWMRGQEEGPDRRWTRASLMRFHERHKFLFMARNQAGMRRLGRLLGESGKQDGAEDLARVYLAGMTEVLRRPPTRRGHTNVLYHLAGFVTDRIDDGDRRELIESIDRYRAGLLPLIVPVTLIRHHVRRLGVEYLRDQVYLEPHPQELMLLNHV